MAGEKRVLMKGEFTGTVAAPQRQEEVAPQRRKGVAYATPEDKARILTIVLAAKEVMDKAVDAYSAEDYEEIVSCLRKCHACLPSRVRLLSDIQCPWPQIPAGNTCVEP